MHLKGLIHQWLSGFCGRGCQSYCHVNADVPDAVFLVPWWDAYGLVRRTVDCLKVYSNGRDRLFARSDALLTGAASGLSMRNSLAISPTRVPGKGFPDGGPPFVPGVRFLLVPSFPS